MIKRIKIGAGSCGIAAGADEILEFFKQNIKNIDIVEVGCIGHCYAEPIVEIETDNGSIFYEKVQPNTFFLNTILNEKKNNRLDFYENRKKHEVIKITKLSGKIDPCSIVEYIKNDGYKALKKALSLPPVEIIKELEKSNLKGRGGGGFPTFFKWQLLANKDSQDKILICNADEGDPGAFMDRSLMESVPHQILEGMLIGAHATNSNNIFIYCRAEYPLAIKNLNKAISQIIEKKINILNGKTINIKSKEGAGAFVCGEETAMIHSLEGERGMPRFRPPYPIDSGYKGLPTSINNVETFANIASIINEGGENYAKIGTENSKGTKLFALAGDLKYSGLVEVPMGLTIKNVVCDIGGAKLEDTKGVQIGGPSGGCIPSHLFDTLIDYESLKKLGAIMGSGGLIVIGKNRCMVETAKYFLEFVTRESCGKCTFCRIGTKRLLERLEKIVNGNGEIDDIEFLKDLSLKVSQGSLCGLGQSAPNPILTTIKYFEDEYLEHIKNKKCPSLVCKALVEISLNKEQCIKCKICQKNCPVDAISQDFVVDIDKCIKCNVCIDLCPKNAIKRISKRQEIKNAN